MSRIVFINRFYFPDEVATAQLLADLAEALARTGREISVVTSAPAGTSSPPFERRHGVSIFRIRSTHWSRRHVLGRIVDFITFQTGALVRLFRLLRRGDVAVTMTDPPLLGVAAAHIARWRGARVVHWVQDIYPEIAVDLTGHRWLFAFRPSRDAAWRRAHACVVPGTDMAATLTQRGVPPARVIVSPNWPPAGLQPPSATAIATLRQAWGLSGKFVIGYSGNLGRVHDLAPLLDVAEALRDRSDVAWLFVGHGAQRTSLEAAANTRQLSNVHFKPPQPRAQLAVSLGVADVQLVTLLPGAERSVFPSKLYGIAAIGRPILVIAPRGCELARLVETHHMGVAFTRDEPAAIARWLQDLANDPPRRNDMAAAARAFADGGFDRALATWQDLLIDSFADSRPNSIALPEQ